MKIKKTLICSATALTTMLLLAGCATQSAPPKVQKPRTPFIPLADSEVARHSGNIQGLFDAWIKPRVRPNGMLEVSATTKKEAWADIKDGMTRFCQASGASLREQDIEGDRVGFDYRCINSQGTMVSQLSVLPYSDGRSSWLWVETNRNARIAENTRKHQQRVLQNGPSGTVTTTAGRFKFFRIGDLDKRSLWEINTMFGAAPATWVPVEEIGRIDFDEKCCGLQIRTTDGRTGKSGGGIHFASSVDQYKNIGAPTFVVQDPGSGQLYARWFDPDTIKSIEIDTQSAWENKQNTAIASTFNPTTPERLREFRLGLQKEAAELMKQAKSQGWWQQVFPDGKLARGLQEDLHFYLARWAEKFNDMERNNKSCEEKPRTGIAGKGEDLMRCEVARKEYALVVTDGLALNVSSTPLSLIHILSRVKQRLAD